jgi:Fe-S-cluster containining protein
MADEARRIMELMNELTSDPAYVTGRRTYPRTLRREDATLITGKLHEAIDEGAEVRGKKAEEAGHVVACKPGCNYCCEQPVLVWLPEALRIAEHLARPENGWAKDAFLSAYPAWRDAVGDGLTRIAELTAADRKAEHMEAHVAAWKKRVLCAFNVGGLCTIYAVRPAVCRNCHALDTPDHCRADDESDVPVAVLQFKPLDDFLGRASDLGAAMHHALGGKRKRTVALCQAVYDALVAQSVQDKANAESKAK